MRKYARMITDDTYYAMRLGPVASNVKDILDFQFDDTEEAKECKQYIVKTSEHNFKAVDSSPELDMLSETDLEALDFAVDTFKGVDLVDETHKYPEWLRFERSFTHGTNNREKIVMSDFFEASSISDDPYNVIPEELTLSSKDIFFGKV